MLIQMKTKINDTERMTPMATRVTRQKKVPIKGDPSTAKGVNYTPTERQRRNQWEAGSKMGAGSVPFWLKTKWLYNKYFEIFYKKIGLSFSHSCKPCMNDEKGGNRRTHHCYKFLITSKKKHALFQARIGAKKFLATNPTFRRDFRNFYVFCDILHF